MLANKVAAVLDNTAMDGIIPLETTPAQASDNSSVLTHHWTNMGMTTWM
jgi:hypothetical protein